MKRARNPKWSFVVMRGANKTVKQFHVSKRSVIAVPALVAISITGCIAGLQWKSAAELNRLEQQLALQYERHFHALESKDESIVTLQSEIAELSKRSDDMKRRMEQLGALEMKLQQFINKYGSISDSTGTEKDELKSQSLHKGGSVTPLSANASSIRSTSHTAAITDLNESALDIPAISELIDRVEQFMDESLEREQARQAAIDGYPSSWPSSSKIVSSSYGYRKDPFTGKTVFHAGIDIQGKQGDPVYSASDGIVSDTGSDSSMGRFITIEHVGELQTVYMHLKQVDVKSGQKVVRGEKIGQVGSSGRSTGPHLHFQIMQKGESVNPLKFLALVKES